MANTIVWFDLPVKNLEKMTAFYATILNQQLEISTEHDFRMTVFQHQENDVAGCLYETKDDIKQHDSGLLIYFNVNKRIHRAVELAASTGGVIVEPIAAIGEYGYRAVILDPEGNKVALHAVEDK